MAAEIRIDPTSPVASTSSALRSTDAKPELINKIDGSAEDIHAAVFIPGQDGIISVSTDRSVRVWLLRDSGQYWPSVCHYMGAAATSLHYVHQDGRRVFVGLENGVVSEFTLSEDFNHMQHVRDYHAHQKRVTSIYYSQQKKWVMSVGHDRYFQFHCKESGRRLGGYLCNAWCTAVEYDEEARYAFIGDYSGQITVCRLDDTGVTLINVLKGHNGSIQTITWDGDRGWLYTGSYDSSIFVWDIAGRKGTVFELHGHRNKVNSICYSPETRTLLSVGEDTNLVLWDMASRRMETSDWSESDSCQLCSRPFFWNLKSMYEQKQIGLRQHHCRKCGKAICDSCSTKRCPLPYRGHEFPVRVCEECYIKITEDEKKSQARFYDMKSSVRYMSYDGRRKQLITVGPDHVIKIWKVNAII